MGIEATGKIYTIFETKHVSDKFTKREFVLELADNPKYKQLVLFQLTGDRVSQLDGLNVGDEVRVEFSLRGREWRSGSGEIRYFNSLDVWKLEPVGKRQERNGTPHVAPPEPPPGDPDDIPFASADMAHDPNPIARVLR